MSCVRDTVLAVFQSWPISDICRYRLACHTVDYQVLPEGTPELSGYLLLQPVIIIHMLKRVISSKRLRRLKVARGIRV